MARDELRAVRDAMDPPWDDLREQRVLRGVRAGRTSRERKRRVMRVAAVCVAVVAIIGVGVGLSTRTHPATVRTLAMSSEAPSASTGSMLSLADGSRLWVQAHADVQVERQAPDEVRLVQRAGEVRYDVRPDPGRLFEVRAGSVRVRVKGTAFRVRVDAESIVVGVDRGRVVVTDDSGSTELGAGEELKRAVNVDEAVSASASATPEASVAAAAPRASAEAVASVEELLARADQARASGRLDEAAAALQQILALHPKDRRTGTVLFTLGRVERARGNHAAAAGDFHACSRGSLAEDALAEEAASWMAAGQPSNARDAAQRYLARFPNGPYVARMQRIVE